MVTALAVIFALTNLGCVVSAQPLPGGLAKDLHRRDPPPGPVPEGWQKKIDDIFEQCVSSAVPFHSTEADSGCSCPSSEGLGCAREAIVSARRCQQI